MAFSGNPDARNCATGVLTKIETNSLIVVFSCEVGSPADAAELAEIIIKNDKLTINLLKNLMIFSDVTLIVRILTFDCGSISLLKRSSSS